MFGKIIIYSIGYIALALLAIPMAVYYWLISPVIMTPLTTFVITVAKNDLKTVRKYRRDGDKYRIVL